MKGFKLLITIYISVMLLAVLQSCCTHEYLISAGGEINAFHISDSNDRVLTDTIQGQFNLDVRLNQRMVMVPTQNPFISTAMATTCDEKILNPIDERNIQLTLNKKFVINGDTIYPGTNILDFEEVTPIVNTYYYGGVEIQFSEEFVNHSFIEKGLYNFNFSAVTSDNIKIIIDKELYLSM